MIINIRAITIYKYVIPRWTGKQYMQSRNRDEERSLHGFRVVICQDPLSLFPLRGQRDDALRDFTESLVVYLYCRVSVTRRPSLVCSCLLVLLRLGISALRPDSPESPSPSADRTR